MEAWNHEQAPHPHPKGAPAHFAKRLPLSYYVEAIKETGIKVWVLTGDKIETAIQIGYATGLLDENMNQHIVDGLGFKEISE